MEEFREKLKIQNIIIAISAFILTTVSILAALGEAEIIPFFKPVGGDSHWQSMWRGFISGATAALFVAMLISLVRGIRALKDEKKLKKLYVTQNDERSIQIWTSARASSMQAFLMLGMVASIVAGYFSATVAFTIWACLVLQSLLGLGFKVYYSKKF